MSRPADADPISRRDVRLSREQVFYDELARGIDPEALPPNAPDVGERALLEALGPVAGRRVLDAGCGTGDLTLHLLALGAKVTALDISPQMVELARARAERFRPGADVRFVVAPVENTRLPDAAFEAVVGKWVLHHSDFPLAAREMARVLVARGRGAFFENQGLNPLLALARRHLVGRGPVGRFGTPDERPLVRSDFEVLRSAFGHLEREYPNVYFFELLSRQVLGSSGLLALRRVDDLVWRRAPPLRRWSYHVLLKVEKRTPVSRSPG